MYSFSKLLAAAAICVTCQISTVMAQSLPVAPTAIAPPEKLIEVAPSTMTDATPTPAEKPNAVNWLNDMKFEGNKKHLDMKPVHRTQNFMEAWAKEKAIDALSFTHVDFIDVQSENQLNFTNAGFTEYQNIIKSLELDKLLSARSYVILTIARGEPTVVKHAPLKGAHRWLVYVPLAISAFQADADNKPTGAAKFTKEVDFSMQLVRVPFDAHEEEVMIESWKLKKGIKK